jgi:hypothetical protein
MLESINLATLLLVGLASARITSLIVLDDLIEPLRHWVFKRSPSPEYVEHGITLLGESAGFLGRLLSCYHCIGVWVSGLCYAAIVYAPSAALPVLTIAAIAQLSDTTIKLSR